MAPQKRAKGRVLSDSSPSAGDGNDGHMDGPRISQGSVDHIVQDMADVLKESTKKRRRARRAKIEGEYRLEMEQLQDSFHANLEDISRRNSELHHQRFTILQGLLHRKATIEKEILESTARLERAYSNASQELHTILTARVNDLRKTLVEPQKV